MIKTRLRESRLALGFSQTGLSYQAQVPSCVISDCERGQRLPWRRARKALADVLKVPEDELFLEQ